MLLEIDYSFSNPTLVLGWSNILVKINTINSQHNLVHSFYLEFENVLFRTEMTQT